jgi:hypothetical protein
MVEGREGGRTVSGHVTGLMYFKLTLFKMNPVPFPLYVGQLNSKTSIPLAYIGAFISWRTWLPEV